MIEQYLDMDHMPHMWCPGCGNGIVMGSFLRAAEACGLTTKNTVVISGIGCSSRMPGYMQFDSLHTAHGRALPVATGVKMARPNLHVIVISGDGDTAAIGGNHFIHACRRNIGLTLIVINNQTYGMTNGQYSPLTPVGAYSSTTVYGNVDRPFDIMRLAEAAGASYVARSSVYHIELLDKYIMNGIRNDGFSVIEALSICPTQYGRGNGLHTPLEMLQNLRDNAGMRDTQGGAEKPYVLGEFHNSPAPEYTALYAQIRERAGNGAL